MLGDERGEEAHERDAHREAVPDEGRVVRVQVVVGRAEPHQRRAAEHRGPGPRRRRGLAVHEREAHQADDHERQVGGDVPEVRDAEQAPLVGEVVIGARLGDGPGEQERDEQRAKRAPEQEEPPVHGSAI